MIEVMELVGFVVELIALIMFFVVVYYIYHIKLLTKGFKETWDLVASGFLLIIFHEGFSFILLFRENSATASIALNIVLSLLLLAISALFILGFYRFKQLCQSMVEAKAKRKRK